LGFGLRGEGEGGEEKEDAEYLLDYGCHCGGLVGKRVCGFERACGDDGMGEEVRTREGEKERGGDREGDKRKTHETTMTET
jgi:hypothetical protein